MPESAPDDRPGPCGEKRSRDGVFVGKEIHEGEGAIAAYIGDDDDALAAPDRGSAEEESSGADDDADGGAVAQRGEGVFETGKTEQHVKLLRQFYFFLLQVCPANISADVLA